MRAIILKGSIKQKEEYIYRYTHDRDIPEYNITNFSDPLKIADVRQIKSSLGKTSMSGKKRLFIISQSPNGQAQNALLKTLEELDEETDFIFLCEEELLPTVVSRCETVVLSTQSKTDPTPQFDKGLIDELAEGDLGKKLLKIQEIFSKNHDDPLGLLILELRRVLRDKIKSGEVYKSAKILQLLKSLNAEYSLVLTNNLNAKVTTERIILGLTT